MKSSWLAVTLVCLVAFQLALVTEAKTRSGIRPSQTLFAALTGAAPQATGDGGGVNCAACTFLIALGEQYAEIHGKVIDKAFYELCSFLPGPLRNVCDDAVTIYMPKIINAIEMKQTPDRVCQELGVCTNLTCSLFPPPKKSMPHGFTSHIKIKTPAGWDPAGWIDRFIDNHEPFIDLDKDDYSTYSTLRGTDWRGKDCDDTRDYIYPGRRNSTQPLDVDFNCNGIYGENEKKQSIESLLCSGTPQYGTAILGDSAAAHFHAPPQYITAADITATTYDDLINILANEFDWPMMSATTGYTYNDWTGHPRGPMLSTYEYIRERNLCTHRDYQNIGVNGARTSSMANSIMYGFHRDQLNDFPVILEYALVGNDVCNGHPGLGHMTTPQEFYTNVVAAMNYLDTVLPKGSFVVFMGLAEGRVLWDAMHDRIHPIGKLRNDVTYADLYDYLNCLEISPCWGWLNSDSYWRNQTSYRALNLSLTYLEVIKNNHYKNFNMTYTNCPVGAIMDEWISQGGEAWELIEPVDGFHPNQIANALIAQHQWKLYQEKYPYLVPPINPNNAEIKKLFGDQGGY